MYLKRQIYYIRKGQVTWKNTATIYNTKPFSHKGSKGLRVGLETQHELATKKEKEKKEKGKYKYTSPAHSRKKNINIQGINNSDNISGWPEAHTVQYKNKDSAQKNLVH